MMENYTPTPAAAENDPVTEPLSPTPSAQTDSVVGTGAFFGLELLFALPIIGFICSIVFSFVPKNRNLKHYARAKMITGLISLLLTVLLVIGCISAVQRFTDFISTEFGLDVTDQDSMDRMLGQLENIGEVAGIVNQIGGADGIGDIIDSVGGIEGIEELIEGVGGAENLEEIVEQIGGAENFEEIVEQIGGAENFEEIVEQYKNVENIDSIVDAVSGIENIEEAIEDVGGMDRLSGLDSIEDVLALAAQVTDPDTKEQILDIIRRMGG